MKIIVHETQCFSSTEVYRQYFQHDEVWIEAKENYQKRSYRNKYNILTSQGVTSLTIPLSAGKNNQKPIKDVRIAYESDWIKIHLNTIRAAYGNSPFFEHYFDFIEKIYSKKPSFLYDFNTESLHFICTKIGCPIIIGETSIYELHYPASVTDYRKQPLSIVELSSNPTTKYVQVWQLEKTFYKNLSILDALFCLGPETKPYILSMEK
ncbi:MAG: WbqC family protein [Saprospiraceae bacterium]